ERGDDKGHLVLHDHLKVGIEAWVGTVDNEIDAIGRSIRMGREPLLDLIQPLDKALRGALVQRRKGSGQARPADLHHEIRTGGQEHGSNYGRQLQSALETSGYRHSLSSSAIPLALKPFMRVSTQT